MEYMNTSLLTGQPLPSSKPIDFAELRVAPKVKVDMDLRPIRDEENLALLDKLAGEGNRVVNIAKQNTRTPYLDRTDFPRRVQLEMTSQCNVLCRMCPRNHLLRPTEHMPTETYIRVLEELSAEGVEAVSFYFLGESLLHPEFRRLVRHAQGLDGLGYTWVSTNGHLLNRSNMEFIMSSGMHFLNFSLHAVSEEVYRTIVPKGDFNRVLKNFKRLAEFNSTRLLEPPYVHLQMIEQETTRGEVNAFIETHYREVEVVSVSMLEYVGLPDNQFGTAQRKRRNQGHCTRVARNDCIICSDGSVTICDGSYNGKEEHVGILNLGNINKESLREIWNNDRRRTILELEAAGRLTEIEHCRTCTDYDI